MSTAQSICSIKSEKALRDDREFQSRKRKEKKMNEDPNQPDVDQRTKKGKAIMAAYKASKNQSTDAVIPVAGPSSTPAVHLPIPPGNENGLDSYPDAPDASTFQMTPGSPVIPFGAPSRPETPEAAPSMVSPSQVPLYLPNTLLPGQLPDVPPDTTDFASVVRGVELSENAPIITWPGGFKTVAPFIPHPDKPTDNVLAIVRRILSFIYFVLCAPQDQEAVERFARLASPTHVDFVECLDLHEFSNDNPNVSPDDHVRRLLGQGKTVVLENFVKAEPYQFSAENIMDSRGLNAHTIYSIHGAQPVAIV